MGNSIAVGDTGNVYVTGATGSANFPTVNAFQTNLNSQADTFVAKIVVPSTGLVKLEQKISDIVGGSGLSALDRFGQSVADLGDVDGDGIQDLAVGAPGNDEAVNDGANSGAMWIIFLNPDGSVKAEQKLSKTAGGFPGGELVFSVSDSGFGRSAAGLGDLDGDGIPDLAVGARSVDDGNPGPTDTGVIWILLLNADGTVKSSQKISNATGGLGGPPPLDSFDRFGTSIANLGDLDGDGVVDLAVGATGDSDGGPGLGAVWILFLNTDGTVKAEQKISATAGGFTGVLDSTAFGLSVANLGDLDGDGVTDLTVGSGSNDGGSNRGAVWILFLNPDGTVKTDQKISDTEGGFAGVLEDSDNFGLTVTGLGDLDGDNVSDVAVGANGDDDGGADRGAVWILFLNPDGTVKTDGKISDTIGGFLGGLNDSDVFGEGLANIGDLDGNGVLDLAVGASGDIDNGGRGELWIVFLEPDSDGDGVDDNVDLCPGTPAGEAVDVDGCSGSQLDTDGDGVTDDLDQCPTTPSGEIGAVNAEGCGPSERDTDGDGVTDDLDQCLTTPSGEIGAVNTEGCGPSERDTDGDGATDDLDQCPGTPNGEPTDSNGCAVDQQPIKLVSINAAGTDSSVGPITSPAGRISTDGRFVAFESSADDLGPTDTNGVGDVYVRDVQTQTTMLVSVNAAGTDSGNDRSSGPALRPVLSADGRFVVFESLANDLGPTDTNTFPDIYVRDLQAGTTALVSTNAAGTDSSSSGGFNPVLSTDGRFVAFVSSGTDLGPPVTSGTPNVYVRDLQTGTTTLANINASGTDVGNGTSSQPALSADGRFVAFTSNATDLGPADTNGEADVYVRDLQTGTTTLVNVNAAGTDSGNGRSQVPTLSGDGRFVAFVSLADDLGPTDTNAEADVYVRDLQTGTTTLANRNATSTDSGNGLSRVPVLSENGRFVAFRSEANDLGPTDTNGVEDVYVRDLQTGTVFLANVNAAGTDSGNGFSTDHALSADGRFVAFTSNANDLGPTDTNIFFDVYVRDLQTGTTILINRNAAGTNSGNNASGFAVISADGQSVAFVSSADDLGPTDTNGTSDIYVVTLSNNLDTDGDGVTNDLDQCPTTPSGEIGAVNAEGCGPSERDTDGDGVTDDLDQCLTTPSGEIGAVNAEGCGPSERDTDGDGVTDDLDQCPATPNGEPTDSNGCAANQLPTTLVSVNATGTNSGNQFSDAPVFSADGRLVVFESAANDLSPITTGPSPSVYVRDLQTGATTLVSINAAGTDSGNNMSRHPAFSADGRLVAFESRASDLGPTDTDNALDVYVRNLQTGTTTLVSVNAAGTDSGNNISRNPVISTDGRFVAFESLAGDLGPTDTNLLQDIYVRNLQTGTTTLVSVNAAGTNGGNNTSSDPMFSTDGQLVVFESEASDLGPTDTNGTEDIYVRDLQAGTMTLVSVNMAGTDSGNNFSRNPMFSADGGLVAFESAANDLELTDTNFFQDIYVRDLQTGTTTLVSVNATGTNGGSSNSASPAISADGRLVAFESTANDLGPADTNGAQDVFVRDLQTGTTTLVSVNAAGTNGGNATSFDPVFSADGRLVAFESAASDLGLTNTNGEFDVYARDLQTGTTTLVSVNAAGTNGGNNRSFDPVFSADGQLMAFASEASDLGPTDTNGTADIYIAPLNLASDTDGDGVDDSVDLCPGTPAEPVDANGCSASQLLALGLLVTPNTVSFGQVGVGNTEIRTFTLSNQTGNPVSGSVTTAAPFSIVSGATFSLAPDESRTFVVRLSPTLAGTFTGSAEVRLDGSPTVVKSVTLVGNSSVLDTDGDGLTDDEELILGTNPNNPDTDGDGVDDGEEVNAGSDPLNDDTDGDTVFDGVDNCLFIPNQLQTDLDTDGVGDACDNWPTAANPGQEDAIPETPEGAACEDTDGDGIFDLEDNCVDAPNPSQADLDADGFGDACSDIDDDQVSDTIDVCPLDSLSTTSDVDGDGLCACRGVVPAICKTVGGAFDNCPDASNPPTDWTDINGDPHTNEQADFDLDGRGDACDTNVGPGPGGKVCRKNCPPEVTDADEDGLSSDVDPDDSNPDIDGDTVLDGADNCVTDANTDQLNTDNDGLGDVCDADDDGDGVLDLADNCPILANPSQADLDGDGSGDSCDGDADGDGHDLTVELEAGTSPTNPDTDGDLISDGPTDPDGPGPISGGPDLFPLQPGVPSGFSVLLAARDTSDTDVTATFLPEDGNAVRIIAQVRDNTTSSLVPFANPVSFTLAPSHLAGIATNDSETFDEVPSNDYSFDPVDTEVVVATANATGLTEAEVLLHAFDYGGTADITAEVELADGTVISGTLHLPLDSDNDGVPNAWEVLHQAAGFDAFNPHAFVEDKLDGDVDLDTSLDNAFDGDGLPNHREYRGILLDGTTHLRLDPRKKDLFVRGANFSNSLPPNPNALPFSLATPGGNAFEEAGIAVHDVTELALFSGPTEPPFLDVLVVTNRTDTTNTLTGSTNGVTNHLISECCPRNWTWDTKGASHIGTATDYGIFVSSAGIESRATEVYHLNLMHYIFNRPYLDESTGAGQCSSGGLLNPGYAGVLDPIELVEDFRKENNLGPERTKGVSEDRFIENNSLDGDQKLGSWGEITYGDPVLEPFKIGCQTSVFDADGDGLVENPPIADPLQELNVAGGAREYTPEEVQTHTILHEMGHAVGMPPEHTSDPADLMYQNSPDWDRAGHFGSLSRGQILIHNTNAGLTLSWVNKLGSEDSGAPPADSPGTSSRVVRTSFASIPGLSL